MSLYPHSRLILGESKSLVISGPHIQLLDTKNGDVIHSTSQFEGPGKDIVLKSGHIRCSAVDREFTRVVTTGDDKKLKVWDVEGLKLLSERELPKKPTGINITRDGKTILVSDKFGDVFSYPMHPDPSATSTTLTESEPLIGASKRGALTSHENPSNGALILGHTSLLTSFLLTEDEKYIVSADRDEHIRVSWYPQGYIIERYCLGHKKFVSAINIPPFSPSTLISGGGDPELKIWDWMSGKHLGDIPILEGVEPFIKVKPQKGRSGWYQEDGEDEPEKPGRRKGKGQKGKDKGKEKEDNQKTPEQEPGVEDVAMTEVVEDASTVEAAPKPSNPEGHDTEVPTPEQAVLVVHHIESVDVGEQGRHIVFNAIGATALFYCAFPSNYSYPPPTIHSLDLSRPVIDFTLGENSRIWVLLDGEWGKESVTGDESVPTTSHPVQLLHWTENRLTLVEQDAPAMLSTLNTNCIIPATPADLKALDLYAHLTSMPKSVDPEYDPTTRDDLSELIADDSTVSAKSKSKKGKSKGKGPEGEKEMTQRELGRLKNKRALIAKIQEKQAQEQTKGEEGGGIAVGEDREEERESKKVKAGDKEEQGSSIVAMDES